MQPDSHHGLLGDGARRDGAAAREVPPDWWRRALLADRSPVEFVLCFATPATAIAVLDPPPFGIWRFEVQGGPPIGWRSASRGQPSVRATLSADAAGERVVLQEGWLPVSLDYRATRQRLHDTLAGWPARAAAEIQSGGWSEFTRTETDSRVLRISDLGLRIAGGCGRGILSV
jgi:hypothetical protein